MFKYFITVIFLCANSFLFALDYTPLENSDFHPKIGAVKQAPFSEDELDTTNISITIVFKAGSTIPSDEILSQTVPLTGHAGPYGRKISGTAREIRNALHLEGFDHWTNHKGRHFFAHAGTPSLPSEWASDVLVILGLNNQQIGHPQIRRVTNFANIPADIDEDEVIEDPLLESYFPKHLPKGWPPFGFFPQQIAKIYGFPKGGLGKGQTIGIVTLTLDVPGLTAGFHLHQIQKYFELIGINPPPAVEIVSVDGAVNQPSNPPTNGDQECCLDICLAGGIAPRAIIEVYFAPNSEVGLFDCFAAMLTNRVPVISCSWVFTEDRTARAFEDLFAFFADQSTICVASGDFGSTSTPLFALPPPSTAQLLMPSTCPHALAIGGTTLVPNGGHTKRLEEVVWNWVGGIHSTGGGVSSLFNVPKYQRDHGIMLRSINNGKPGRATPDVALNADPNQGYNIRVGKFNANGIGGTSAATPIWAGLIARLNHINDGKPLGFINPLLYDNHSVLRPITEGSNGQYFADGFYSACCGLGVPTRKIVELVRQKSSSSSSCKCCKMRKFFTTTLPPQNKVETDVLKMVSTETKQDAPFPIPGVPPGEWDGPGYFPFELSRIYEYPISGFGKGQTIALIELSGGFSHADLANYWINMGLTRHPKVKWIGVDGATNNYSGDRSSDDWIVTSDIEIVGTIAPLCSILVIFAPNTTQGIFDAISEALSREDVTIISTVWGKPESEWPVHLMHKLDRMIAKASSRVTVIASSGSHGSSDGVHDGLAHVDFPASSPNVLAVGTTTLITDSDHLFPVFECAWNEGFGRNATGGGVSEVFPVPEYQKSNGIIPRSVNPGHKKGRGVPDVSSVGDPLGQYPVPIFVDGVFSSSIPAPHNLLFRLNLPCGTVATPTWAGLIARLKSISEKPLGLLQPAFYSHPEWFRDIQKGSNGDYKAHKGYDLTTGLGVPTERIVEVVDERVACNLL